MTVNQYNQYTGNIKPWDEFDHLIPNVEYGESHRPPGEFRVAPWLPSADGLYTKQHKDYFTVMPGKVVSFTRDGWVVPAGLGVKIRNAADTSYILAYDVNDLNFKAQSLVTGTYVAAADTAANSGNGYTKGAITTALRNQGLLRSDETLDDYISAPVGVAPYAYKMAENHSADKRKYIQSPYKDRFHNYRTQHQVAIVCDYVLELPWVPELQSAEIAGATWGTLYKDSSYSNVWYAAATNAGILPLAQDNARTPWVFATDGSGWFTNRQNDIRDLRATGDYMVDADLGRLYFFETATATSVVGGVFATGAIQVYTYNSTDDASVSSNNYACVVGDVKPGCYLKPTEKSNWIPVAQADVTFAPTTTAINGTFSTAGTGEQTTAINAIGSAIDQLITNAKEQASVIGQVLEIRHHPRGMLQDVRTMGDHLNYSSSLYRDMLPGSATAGLPDKVTYAAASNKTVTINIIRK